MIGVGSCTSLLGSSDSHLGHIKPLEVCPGLDLALQTILALQDFRALKGRGGGI